MTKFSSQFSFADYARDFDDHITLSIPGYTGLVKKVVAMSTRFVQPGTNVYDIGCTTGRVIAAIRHVNHELRPGVSYIGIDCEPAFAERWQEYGTSHLDLRIEDVRLTRFDSASLVTSIFTVQFVPPKDKRRLLKRICDGLVEGGALLVAEKTLASTARLQDALTFPYYDLKLANGFSPEHILQKERKLRGQMTLWSEAELRQALNEAGFREVERIWGEAPFAGFIALK